MKFRTYRELSRLKTFEERYLYLRLRGLVGESTFGYDRAINQMLYTSQQWKESRQIVIIRDNGCDLGVEGYDIYGRIIVHHMNPITLDDILNNRDIVFDPELLICTTHRTHNAIHYGDENQLPSLPIERTKNDTIPWK